MNLDYQSLDDEVLVKEIKFGIQEAFNVLLSRYAGRINNMARRFSCRGITFDDFFQEGSIGLFIAAIKYQPERRVPFHVFAELHIRGKIINALRSAMRNKHYFLNQFVSLYSSPTVEEDGGTLIGIIPNNEPTPEEILLVSEVNTIINSIISTSLTNLERDALLKIRDGCSYKEAAEDMGVGIKTIDNAFRRAKKKFTAFYSIEMFA